ncbi:hypothetical protein Tco_0396927 [Tanacetum coccineum]
MVAFLSKPAESEGFEQIVDFLNAHPIKNALTLQALVDGKKIIITESTVRIDLQLEDAKGVDCLPNATIFEQLALMGMVKNLDNVGKFLMYPRFVQVFLDKQLEGMSNHNRIYVTPSHTKKIFRNMRRVGKGFSGKETPLFKTMVVQDQAEIDKAVYKELDDSLVRAATVASSLEAEQDSSNIIKTRSMAKPNEACSQGTTLGGNTLRSGKDSLKLNELMELCTNLQIRVLDLKKTKITQAEEIGRINAIDADEDITLVNDQDDADMFDVNTLTGDEVLAEPEVTVKNVNLTVDEVTLAQALVALKSVKPKVKANVVEEPNVPVSAASTIVSAATTTTTATIPTPRKEIIITELDTSTTTTISLQPSQEKVQDKGKGIMVEEHVKSMKKKDLVRLDEEIAAKLQAKFDEKERLTREKDEANVALTGEWDDIQAKVDADYQMAQRLQAQEQEELTDEEK